MFDEINKQKQKYETGIVIGTVISIISFILFIPLMMGSGPGGFIIIIIPFIGGTLYARVQTKNIKEMSNIFKQKYVEKELEKIFPNSKYLYNSGFTEQEVVNSKLLHNQDRYSSEDMIIGHFDGVGFRCSDVHQKDVRRSGKTTTVVTVFQGRFYEFDFFKNFKYNMLLLQPYNYRPFENFKKIKLESIHFNSEFKVYARDEHEAFYILTPHFMERLLVLDRKYQDKISFSFKDNKLFIAVDNRIDNFDIKAFQPLDKNFLNSYIEEFQDMKEFITLLTLNSKLFKPIK